MNIMAHRYTAQVIWELDGQDFPGNKYSRRHRLCFDGGIELAGSASPQMVPSPFSDASAVDPEELFVASLSSCHMLWFLSIAAEAGYCVERYCDNAEGTMARGDSGRICMTRVTLRPDVTFNGGRLPSRTELDVLHHRAHEECFIANSVLTEVRCEPVCDNLTAFT